MNSSLLQVRRTALSLAVLVLCWPAAAQQSVSGQPPRMPACSFADDDLRFGVQASPQGARLEMLVTDPTGATIGKDALTKHSYDSATNATYGDDDQGLGKEVWFRSPEDGVYRVRLTTTVSGTYSLYMSSQCCPGPRFGRVEVTRKSIKAGIPQLFTLRFARDHCDRMALVPPSSQRQSRHLSRPRKNLIDLVAEDRGNAYTLAALQQRPQRNRWIESAEENRGVRKRNFADEHLSIRRFGMPTGTHAQEGVSAVPLLNAVFCAGCETISNSPHEVCIVCGSRSLTSLSRLLGGKLESKRPRAAKAAYDLEVIATVREVPAAELNHLIQSITRLAAAGDLERLHINVESVFDTEGLIRAA